MNYKLLPHRFKMVGWILFLFAFLAEILLGITGNELSWLKVNAFTLYNSETFGNGSGWFQWVQTNLTYTLVAVIFIVGGLIISFSKEKTEDELIAKLRLSSFSWAVCINYLLLLMAFLLVQGFAFLTVMIYNMFTVLILFIVRFNYLLYKNNKMVPDEKYN